MLSALRIWETRRWGVAFAAAVATALLVGVPTDVVPNPVFGRSMPVTWWSYPVLAVTAVLGGLLVGTYVRDLSDHTDRPARTGGIGGVLSYFAVGCPVCNKVAVIALGTVGARRWFEPVQPFLAVASIVLLWWALRARLRSHATLTCPTPVASGRGPASSA